MAGTAYITAIVFVDGAEAVSKHATRDAAKEGRNFLRKKSLAAAVIFSFLSLEL